ncbi:MAG: N-acetyl-gamma-glutamyl-phosphate reductase [Clostridia bacterium]|nr:N-acetyl-gamma-glutamyl-phosphate reductase [Clostridia bacterium]
MMVKVFIDGKEGTTGLELHERLKERKDIELTVLPEEMRKNREARRECINSSDIVFLCLPDDAARDAVAFVDNDKVRIIDASTAHRTEAGWAYGFPELSQEMRNNIIKSNRVAVPGCHASGFLALIYPLIKLGIMPSNYPVVCHSLTGYSGGGKKMIAEYDAMRESGSLKAPRQYALSQEHKHLKEMQYIGGLQALPLFNPIVCDYYRGMEVTVPIYSALLINQPDARHVHAALSGYYEGQKLVKVMPFEYELSGNMLAADMLAGHNGMNIQIFGNSERIVLSAVFDNLGKGASGAAVQCMNIMLGLPDDYMM